MYRTKKSLLALAALSVFASAAHAQSSVTLYGIIDTGVNYISNVQTADPANTVNGRHGNRQYNLSSGVMQGSRWGLRGSQDLGNGLKAIFTLESGFDVNTGRFEQGGSEFGRQAYVGLAGDFGALTIGRQYDSVVDFVAPLAALNRGLGDFGAHPGDLDNFDNSARINNSIKYTSTDYNGLTFGGLYSLGGVPGHNAQNQVWSLGAGYANGPLALGVAYLNAKNPNLSLYGNDPDGTNNNNLGNATNFGTQINPVIAGFASARSLQVIGAGGTYAFGPFTVGLNYSNTKFKDLNDPTSGNNNLVANDPLSTNPNGFNGTATLNTGEISLGYQFSPVLSGIVAFDYTRSNSVTGQNASIDGAKYRQFGAGLDYWISKSTDIYVLGAYQRATGVDSTNQSAVAMIGSFTPADTSRQTAVRVGLRHRF